MTENNRYHGPDGDPNGPSPEEYFKALTDLGFVVQSLYIQEGDTYANELVPTRRGLKSRNLVDGERKRRERFEDTH